VEPHRAKEIVNSLGVIEVLHRDAPVWIERIDRDRVEVQYLGTGDRAEVSVYELVEHTDPTALNRFRGSNGKL
jgi:H-type small acid-soluble spore protein